MPRLMTTMVMDVEALSREAAMEEALRAAGKLRSTDDESAALLEALTAALKRSVAPKTPSDVERGDAVAAQMEALRAKARALYRTMFPCAEEITDDQIDDDRARLSLSVRLVDGERSGWDVEIIREMGGDPDETEVLADCADLHGSAAEALAAFESEHLS